jgi:hypothetical protein
MLTFQICFWNLIVSLLLYMLYRYKGVSPLYPAGEVANARDNNLAAEKLTTAIATPSVLTYYRQIVAICYGLACSFISEIKHG